MFIMTNLGYINTDHVKLYKNHWRKNGKEYEKNGCTIEFIDENIVNVDDHIDISEEPYSIIPAPPGCVAVKYCEGINGETEFYFEPIIAFKIDKYGSSPISCTDSLEASQHTFMLKDDPRVFSYDCTWDTLEFYKESVIKKT